MTLLLQLLAADLRRVWLLASLSTGIHVCRLLLAERGPVWALQHPDSFVLSPVGVALLILDVVMGAVVLARIVHADPVGDDRAFWLTRPISARDMFTAKLVALTGVLVLVPAALNTVWLTSHGAPVSALVAASLQLTLSRLGWVAIAWIVAAATPSVTAFIGVLAGSLLAAVAAVMASISWSTGLGAAYRTSMQQPTLPLPDDTPTYVALLVLVLLGLALVQTHYWTRRWKLTTPLAIPVLALTWFLFGQRTPAIAKAEAPPPPAWVLDEDHTQLDLDAPRRLETGSRSITPPDPEPVVDAETFLRVTGIPDDYSVTVVPHSAQLTTRTGAYVTCWLTPTHPDSSPHERLIGLSRATNSPELLDSVGVSQLDAGSRRVRLKACSAPIGEMRRVAGSISRLDTVLEIRLTQHRVSAVLPLNAAASVRLQADQLVQLAGTATAGSDGRILLRRLRYPSIRPRVTPILTVAVRDPAGRTRAVETTVRRTDALFPLGFTLTLRSDWGSLGTPWASEWQSLEELIVTIPAHVTPAAWLRDSSLILFESSYAGRVTRPVTIGEVYVAPLGRD
jgi:hypothetical protein